MSCAAARSFGCATAPRLENFPPSGAAATGARAADPPPEEASRYLREREGTVTATTQAGVYQLVKIEQPSYAIFDLRDISLATPLRLHWNKMNR